MSKQALKVSVIVPVYNNGLYLRETLESLKQQTMRDFEVIVVNDGSSDNSEEIIDEFVKQDERFRKISQENQGVSAARNAALAVAKGAYVTFVDGDDTLPADALKAMNQVAESTKAELIIGGIQRVDGFTKKINQRTQKLKNKPVILKDDLDLVHGLSLCNKWFLREIIEKNHLRLEKFRHLEDGVFLYNFLQYAKTIKFCDAIIYNYLKRVPIGAGSVTQRVEKGLLESAIGAFERLQELTKDYSEEFKQELAYRINSTTFIGDYYKKIWYLDEETENLLLERVNKIWETQSEEHKAKTIDTHKGMCLEKGIRGKEQLLKDVLFTIVICPIVSEETINVMLKSIYGQAVPAFRIILDESYRKSVHDSFRQMKNITFARLGTTQQEWFDFARGINHTGYLMFVDQDLVFDHDVLAKAYGAFRKNQWDVLQVRVVQRHGLLGMAGLIFAGHYKDYHVQRKYPMQKDAMLIAMQDLDRVQELTKPGKAELLKQRVKKILKSIRKKIFR